MEPRPEATRSGSPALRRAFAAAVLLLLGILAAPSGAAAPVEVAVDVHILSVGNYDANRGTYTLDFYLKLAWDPSAAPEGFTPDKFEFMNGRAASRERIADDEADGRREVWYRVQANLYKQPVFRDYPFDEQVLELAIEDAVHPAEELVYVPSVSGSGLDDDARIGGWRVKATGATEEVKAYPFGESYSRLTFSIVVERPTLGVALRSFLPPAAFCLVAAIAFLLHPSKSANRVTLGTGMIISAVGFHVSQTVGLPSLPRLTLFDAAMVATYTFIAASLAVTTLIMVDEDYWKESDHTRQINRWGAVAAVLLPVVAFLLLRSV